MNIEEIRKNAPEGATHYDKFGGYWKIVRNDGAYFKRRRGDRWCKYAFDDYMEYINDGTIKPL